MVSRLFSSVGLWPFSFWKQRRRLLLIEVLVTFTAAASTSDAQCGELHDGWASTPQPAGVCSVVGVGATGDGKTDDSPAVAKAASVVNQGTYPQPGDRGQIYFPRGTYTLRTNLKIDSNVKFSSGAVIQPSAGITVAFAGHIEAGPWQIFDLSRGGQLVVTPKNSSVNVCWWGLSENKDQGAAILNARAIQAAMATGRQAILYETPDPAAGWYVQSGVLTLAGAGGHALSGALPNTVINQVGTGPLFRFKTPAITIEHLSIRGSEADDVPFLFDTSTPGVVLRDIVLRDITCLQTRGIARDSGSAGSEWHAGVTYNVGDFAFFRGATYCCRNAHVSGRTFDPEKWERLKHKLWTFEAIEATGTRGRHFDFAGITGSLKMRDLTLGRGTTTKHVEDFDTDSIRVRNNAGCILRDVNTIGTAEDRDSSKVLINYQKQNGMRFVKCVSVTLSDCYMDHVGGTGLLAEECRNLQTWRVQCGYTQLSPIKLLGCEVVRMEGGWVRGQKGNPGAPGDQAGVYIDERTSDVVLSGIEIRNTTGPGIVVAGGVVMLAQVGFQDIAGLCIRATATATGAAVGCFAQTPMVEYYESQSPQFSIDRFVKPGMANGTPPRK